MAIVLLAALFLILTWVEFRIINTSEDLPFLHSIFFFGLVNFNIIILLFMLFLIFRNWVKAFIENRSTFFGTTLRAKLIASFVTFSFVPTVLMFLISFGYINSSFDKWFSVKVSSVLKSSLEVTNAYYLKSKRTNYHFAEIIKRELEANLVDLSTKQIESKLQGFARQFALDSVEFYKDYLSPRIAALGTNVEIKGLPYVSIEILEKGFEQKAESSLVHQYAKGNLIRAMVPVLYQGDVRGVLIVSSYIPASLVAKTDEIAAAYSSFQGVSPFEYPVKSIYLIILSMMTLVILFAATWFGFYLAQQLSVPLVSLAQASRSVSKGDYSPVEVTSGSEEIQSLVEAFNSMSQTIEQSSREIRERSQYVEVVLGNVTTGVISIDSKGFVTTVNSHAAQLLNIDPAQFIGRPVRDLMTRDQLKTFKDMLREMQNHQLPSLQKQVQVTLNDGSSPRPFLVNLSLLKSDNDVDLGKVLVFDDLSPIIGAQRAAAWTEVARRIAHEIKNPLTPIKLAAQRLQRKFGAKITDSAFEESVSMIINQVDVLKVLVSEFSQFARLPVARKVKGSLKSAVKDAVSIYKHSHPRLEIELVDVGGLPLFPFDYDQIQRVLQNLIENAMAAYPAGAKSKVHIFLEWIPDRQIAQIRVSDWGVGIPLQNRERVFEPYFSTKETGTGLGLPIVKRIVEDHGGYIRVSDHNGEGTCMIIELPVPPVVDMEDKDVRA